MHFITDHLIIVGFVLVVLLGGFAVYDYYSSSTSTGCVVTEKDRVSKSEGGSEMRVYTENCGTFQVSDSIFKTGFNAADRYAKIKVGETYDITHYGWRFGLFSMFPKIDEAK